GARSGPGPGARRRGDRPGSQGRRRGRPGAGAVNELLFEVSGEGEPVVLVPGFPFGGRAFRQLAPMLATRFRVLMPDLIDLEGGGSRAQAAAIRGRLRDLG